MFEEINRFFDNVPTIILDELRKKGNPLNNLCYDEIIASICYLCSIICNKQITRSTNLELPDIPKSIARDIIKTFLNYIDTKIINFYLDRYILLSETQYNPINTIALYDLEQTIRAVNIEDDVIEQIWNNLPLQVKKNKKIKRYFKYKLDNPPLSMVIGFLSGKTDDIDYVKGHGMSPIVRIPKIIDGDLSYLLGAIRDGGIHYDRKNNAYKIHFEQRDKNYLEEEIQPRLERLFDLDTKITPRSDGVHQIQFASKPLYLLLSKCFGMREIHQFWKTPILIEEAPFQIKKEYIKGFFDAEGTYEHIYHSWFKEDECPPLEFISNVLYYDSDIRCTEPRRIKTNTDFNRFPAYQIFINDYYNFQKEILESSY